MVMGGFEVVGPNNLFFSFRGLEAIPLLLFAIAQDTLLVQLMLTIAHESSIRSAPRRSKIPSKNVPKAAFGPSSCLLPAS